MATSEAAALRQLRHALDEANRRHEQDRAIIAMLRGAIDRNRRETQHQVRNIFSVIRSIVRRTAVEGETIEAFQARLDGRLASFARLQGHILRNPPGGIDLATLVSDELLAFGIGLGARAHVDGADVRLFPKAASVLGLAFHELACMAIGGGGHVGSDARIDVEWRMEPDAGEGGRLSIEWADSRRDADTRAEPDAAFGREFLEQAVSYELGGDVQLNAAQGGLICRFRIPAENVVAR